MKKQEIIESVRKNKRLPFYIKYGTFGETGEAQNILIESKSYQTSVHIRQALFKPIIIEHVSI